MTKNTVSIHQTGFSSVSPDVAVNFLKSIWRSCGTRHHVTATTRMVISPPKTTEGTVPISLAASPLSKAPISLDYVIKIELTDDTRPFMRSGVRCWISEARTTTLTSSITPATYSAKNDSQNHFDKPKVMMHSPKPATQ